MFGYGFPRIITLHLPWSYTVIYIWYTYDLPILPSTYPLSFFYNLIIICLLDNLLYHLPILSRTSLIIHLCYHLLIIYPLIISQAYYLIILYLSHLVIYMVQPYDAVNGMVGKTLGLISKARTCNCLFFTKLKSDKLIICTSLRDQI